jgi:hypothetical protein
MNNRTQFCTLELQYRVMHTWSGGRLLPGMGGDCCSCFRRKWLSTVSCEVCFASRSFSSIRSLFSAVNFAFTLTNRVASLRCFSRHLQAYPYIHIASGASSPSSPLPSSTTRRRLTMCLKAGKLSDTILPLLTAAFPSQIHDVETITEVRKEDLNKDLSGEGGQVRLCTAPSVLEPDFDLLGFNVCKDRAVLDELLAPDRTGLGALMVHTLQSLHLLISVANVLPGSVHPLHACTPRSSLLLPPRFASKICNRKTTLQTIPICLQCALLFSWSEGRWSWNANVLIQRLPSVSLFSWQFATLPTGKERTGN